MASRDRSGGTSGRRAPASHVDRRASGAQPERLGLKAVLVIGLAHRVMDVYLFDRQPTYSLRHGFDLPQKLDDFDPRWIILYYPNHLSTDHAALLQQRGYNAVQDFRGWVDWNNGNVQVYEHAIADEPND